MDVPPEIVLGSTSPRRRELLALLSVEFSVVAPEVDEVPLAGERPTDFAERAARDKAAWVHGSLAEQGQRSIVIGADTVVTLDGAVLGKPRDEAHAREMLSLLSGKAHDVVTGLCVVSPEGTPNTLHVTTRVTMNPLPADEIASYVASGEPMDKAGAYAIQSGAAYMVSGIEGSYTNVVGLPLAELRQLLKEQGAI